MAPFLKKIEIFFKIGLTKGGKGDIIIKLSRKADGNAEESGKRFEKSLDKRETM